jgi:hypothetical protein
MFVGTVVCLDPRELKERPNEIVFGKGCFNNFLHEWPVGQKRPHAPQPKNQTTAAAGGPGTADLL